MPTAMKCDMCDKPAVVHEVILRNGVKQELPLREKHAAEQGYALPGQPPLEKILQQFVMASEPKGGPTITTTISCD